MPTPSKLLERRALGALALCAAILATLPGCTGRGGSGAVDTDRAQEVLRLTLDHWKQGDSIDTLKTGSPSIVAQDFDWMAGQALVSYEVGGAGKNEDINLRVPVRLTLRNKAGKEITKNVNYLVSTHPALTVFRDFN